MITLAELVKKIEAMQRMTHTNASRHHRTSQLRREKSHFFRPTRLCRRFGVVCVFPLSIFFAKLLWCQCYRQPVGSNPPPFESCWRVDSSCVPPTSVLTNGLRSKYETKNHCWNLDPSVWIWECQGIVAERINREIERLNHRILSFTISFHPSQLQLGSPDCSAGIMRGMTRSTYKNHSHVNEYITNLSHTQSYSVSTKIQLILTHPGWVFFFMGICFFKPKKRGEKAPLDSASWLGIPLDELQSPEAGGHSGGWFW